MEVTGNEFGNAQAEIYPSTKQPLLSSEKNQSWIAFLNSILKKLNSKIKIFVG